MGGDINKNLEYINIVENISAMLMYLNLSVLSSMIFEAGAPQPRGLLCVCSITKVEVNQHDMSRNSLHKLSPHIGGWRLGDTRLKLKFPSRLIDKLSHWPEVDHYHLQISRSI